MSGEKWSEKLNLDYSKRNFALFQLLIGRKVNISSSCDGYLLVENVFICQERCLLVGKGFDGMGDTNQGGPYKVTEGEAEGKLVNGWWPTDIRIEMSDSPSVATSGADLSYLYG